jgi:hypothetical protein
MQQKLQPFNDLSSWRPRCRVISLVCYASPRAGGAIGNTSVPSSKLCFCCFLARFRSLSGGTDNGFTTMFDTGNLTISFVVPGITPSPSIQVSETVTYGQTDTPATLVQALANKFSTDSNATTFVTASVVNGQLSLVTTADGRGTNYAITLQSATIGGYTAEQRFFLGFARTWCENVTPELALLARRGDPHAPGRWRANGVVRNMPEFQRAFGCTSGQPMVAQTACRAW